MAVAGDAEALRNVLILNGVLENCSGCKLTYMLTVEVLPWCLADERGQFEVAPPFGQVFIRDQNIGASPVQVDANAVACLEKGEAAARRSFG